jgi:hypothetical protein
VLFTPSNFGDPSLRSGRPKYGRFEKGTFTHFDWIGDVSLRSTDHQWRKAEPSSNSIQKHKRRRFLAALEMTRLGRHLEERKRRGVSSFPLLQLYPKEFLPFSGLVGKGSFYPFPILGDPSQKAFGTTLRVGWEGGLLSLPNIGRSFATLRTILRVCSRGCSPFQLNMRCFLLSGHFFHFCLTLDKIF